MFFLQTTGHLDPHLNPSNPNHYPCLGPTVRLDANTLRPAEDQGMGAICIAMTPSICAAASSNRCKLNLAANLQTLTLPSGSIRPTNVSNITI